MTRAPRPLPPLPTPGRPCSVHPAAVATVAPVATAVPVSIGWRWYVGAREWCRVCRGCDGGPGIFRDGGFVPDWAVVERDDQPASAPAPEAEPAPQNEETLW